MAQKRINDLQLRSDFDENCNMPTDDLVQTWRITGQQVLDFIYGKIKALSVVVPESSDHVQIFDSSDSANPKRSLVSEIFKLGKILSIRTETATYLATLSDDVILVNAASGAVTVNLPAASTATGKKYSIKKIDSSVNKVTIDANSTETIDGAVTVDLAFQYEANSIACNGTAWFII